MEFLNWRTVLAVLIGGLLAGLILGAFNLYQQKRIEEIAQKLYIADKLIAEGKIKEVESLDIPPPSVGYVYLKLGDYFASQKELDKSLEYFQRAVKIFKDNGSVLYYFSTEKVGYLLYLKGEYEKSLKTLKGLGEDIPNYCEVKLLEAQNYAALSRYQKMEQILKRLVEVCNDREIKLTAQYLMAKYKKEETK
jgi:tetratricopeptide (TPR) repeat protein